MIVYPNIDPIAFRLGPFKVHWYGIMYLIGFATAWLLARRRAARPGSTWKPADVDDLVFFGMVGGILGGRLGYVLVYGLSFWTMQNPWYPFEIWNRGMSIHGGFIGGIIAVAIFAWRRGRSVGDVFDFTAPLPAPGLFFGRMGNFINGELWGRTTALPWGFLYRGEVRQPSQLYEGFLEGIVLFTVMWWFTATSRPRLAPSGTLPGAVRHLPIPRRIRARAGPADRLSRLGLANHGPGAIAPYDTDRRHLPELRLQSSCALGQLRGRAFARWPRNGRCCAPWTERLDKPGLIAVSASDRVPHGAHEELGGQGHEEAVASGAGQKVLEAGQ
jgi:phosphatidylglycerol:prolipoprotein diacylglycerol transferase